MFELIKSDFPPTMSNFKIQNQETTQFRTIRSLIEQGKAKELQSKIQKDIKVDQIKKIDWSLLKVPPLNKSSSNNSTNNIISNATINPVSQPVSNQGTTISIVLESSPQQTNNQAQSNQLVAEKTNQNTANYEESFAGTTMYKQIGQFKFYSDIHFVNNSTYKQKIKESDQKTEVKLQLITKRIKKKQKKLEGAYQKTIHYIRRDYQYYIYEQMLYFRDLYYKRKNYRKLVLRRELSQTKQKHNDEKERFSLLSDALVDCEDEITNKYLIYPRLNNIINIFDIEEKANKILYIKTLFQVDQFQQDTSWSQLSYVMKVKQVTKFIGLFYEHDHDFEQIAKDMKMNLNIVKVLYDILSKTLEFSYHLKELRKKRTIKNDRQKEIIQSSKDVIINGLKDYLNQNIYKTYPDEDTFITFKDLITRILRYKDMINKNELNSENKLKLE